MTLIISFFHRQNRQLLEICDALNQKLEALKAIKTDPLQQLKRSFILHPYLIIPQSQITAMDDDEMFKNASHILHGDRIYNTISWEHRKTRLFESVEENPSWIHPDPNLKEETCFYDILKNTIERYHRHYFWLDDPLVTSVFTQGAYCYDENYRPILRLCRSDNMQTRDCYTLKDAMDFTGRDLQSLQTSLLAFSETTVRGVQLFPLCYLSRIPPVGDNDQNLPLANSRCYRSSRYNTYLTET